MTDEEQVTLWQLAAWRAEAKPLGVRGLGVVLGPTRDARPIRGTFDLRSGRIALSRGARIVGQLEYQRGRLTPAHGLVLDRRAVLAIEAALARAARRWLDEIGVAA